MIKVSKAAAERIKAIAADTDAENMMLRIAARIEEDGSYEYGMGFDERKENDTHINMEGVDIIVSENCTDILEDAILDFVEVEDGQYDFIFFNPNDPSHKQPKG